MSALLGPRASSNSRGQSQSRAKPRSRGFGRGGGSGRNLSQPSSDVSMGDAPAGQQPSPRRLEGESGARRQTSPRRTGGDSREARRARRHLSPDAPRGDRSRQYYKPPPFENRIRNKSWVNPDSLNASFQSHAGKVVDPRKASWRNRPFDPAYRKQIDDLYQTLKEDRKRERIKAIKDGFLADPAKPTTLDCAITPVGTCQDMCPEFERVERIMQNTVDGTEKIFPSPEAREKLPNEDIMVKKFRRSAAGYEEQLPSDIRPPLVLQKTLDYLIDGVVGGPEPLAIVHGFVWDRTRSIRNDFSIQQVTKIEDVKIAIDCFERIVRFHILSLHQLSESGEHGGEFNAHQERTQLNNALLSLHHYYEDNQNTFISPNEAEFRAYAIIFEIQDLRPDVEDRLQNLPKHILKDRRVQTALKLYAAAANTSDRQGPLQPYTKFMTAQANTGGFWSTVQSNSVSYLMACVSEIYFNHVRRTCLNTIWKAYKGKRAGPTREGDNWMLNDLTAALGFDNEEQTRTFCVQEGFTITQSENGESYIDLGSVDGGKFTDQKSQPKQTFSRNLVELKRLGRTLPAVINGMSASQAQAQGFVEEMTDAETNSTGNDESLFVDGDSENEQMQTGSESENTQKRPINGHRPKLDATASPFGTFLSPALGTVPGSSPFPTSSFGKPNGMSQTPTAQEESTNPLDTNSGPLTQTTSAPLGISEPPKFDFLAPATMNQMGDAKKPSDGLPGKEPLKFDFGAAATHPSNTNNSLGSSPFAKPSGATPSILDHPSTTTSVSFPAQKETVSGQPSISSAFTASGPAKSLFDKPPITSNPPAFSFGTSPLFQPVTKHQIPSNKSVGLSSPQNDTTNKLPVSPTLATTNPPTNPFVVSPTPAVKPAPPSPTKGTLLPGIAPTPTSFTPERFENSKTPQPALFPPKFATEDLLQPSLGSNQSQSQFTSTYQKPSTGDLSKQKYPAAPKLSGAGISAPLSTASTLSGSTAVETISSSSQQDPVTSLSILPESRSATLDKLADAIMLGDKGLLQQFVEFTLGPIIQSSIKQLEDEDSWNQARECRVILLSRKYLRRWRANAWSMSLMRKARERRRNFAKSIRDSARSTPNRQSDLMDSLRSSGIGSRSPSVRQQSPASTMLPPSTPFQNRQSLPNNPNHDQAQPEVGKRTKRKRDPSTTGDIHHRTPKTTKISHQRSRTVGNSIMSAPPCGLSHSPYKSKINISTVPEGSMLNDILMKQARRLAPTARSDTTQTDYFRLKALGIDPDTPVVPSSKKRPRAESMTGDNKSSEKVAHENQSRERTEPQPASQNPASPSRIRGSAKNDDDDALFAQIRSVREALAESEQWMQSERQSIERSTASKQASMSPPNPETPAQRRLRQIKERGHQSSRTEVRLRALGDKALLPKGFWDGEGMGLSLMKGKGKEREDGLDTPTARLNHSGQQMPNGYTQQPPNGLMGFAALGQMNGVTPSHGDFLRQDSEEAKKGASADDAIEL